MGHVKTTHWKFYKRKTGSTDVIVLKIEKFGNYEMMIRPYSFGWLIFPGGKS